jgi:hypothetical protein
MNTDTRELKGSVLIRTTEQVICQPNLDVSYGSLYYTNRITINIPASPWWSNG